MSPGLTSTLAEMSPRLSRSLQPHAVLLASFLAAHQHGSVAVGKVGQAPDGDHHVQHGHLLAVRHRRRFRGLADDADLLAGTHRKPVTTTVTTGSRVYLPSAFSMSRARSVGLRPCATRSSTSGVEMRRRGAPRRSTTARDCATR